MHPDPKPGGKPDSKHDPKRDPKPRSKRDPKPRPKPVLSVTSYNYPDRHNTH